MAQAFNKFTKKYIGDIMEQEGFVPYKTTDFIRLKEDNRLLQLISFTSGTSGGYRYLVIAYLPLFMFFDKSTGYSIAGRVHNKAPCGWCSLRWNFPKDGAETIEKSMLGIRDVLLKYSIPYLNKYSTFESVLQMMEEDNLEIVPPLYTTLFEMKALYKGYFALGAKDYSKAENYFKEYYSSLGPNYVINEATKEHKEEMEMLVEAVKNPEDIEKLMEKNRQNTIKILNLKKYVDVD
ncbi:hypothetical protein [uncultured Methanolobus sp.]|uniref:hypothetical protein n=1 Tax=uncultured Methanolobus sp. TaxID=218300 RepID=UPI002AABBC7C|nr:hypothetical protein [uncultured Methanolobus sp.]